MLIAQISDFHIVRPGIRLYGPIDSRAMLRRAVTVLNRLHPQPDLVIGSGDLVESGAPEEYAELRDILADLRAPFAPAAGNHDDRAALLRAFGAEVKVAPSPYVQYVRMLGRIQVVILDTVTENSSDPSFGPNRAAWLERVLAGSIRPSLLVTHHPVFQTGIGWMDPPSLEWSDHLGEIVSRHQGHVIGIVSGHIHRAIQARAFGVSASSCPSTAHQVALDFECNRSRFTAEAPGFQLHRIEEGALTTYTASFDRFLDQFDPHEDQSDTEHRICATE